MSIIMRDTCRLAQVSYNGYGDRTVEDFATVDCLFLQGTGSAHSNNAELNNSDAHVYLDIYNEAIRGIAYRVEGMYLIINPFGYDDTESWYKIFRVKVGQKKLTDNEVDNVHAFLQKVAAP